MLKASGKQFGKNVGKLRYQKKLTQEKLAEKADISRRYVQLIEAGNYVPTIEVAAKLRKAFQVSWDELLHGI